MSAPKRGRRTGTRLVWATLILGLIAAGVYFGPRLADRNSSDTENPVFVAKSGPLVISINESGTIKAREQVVLKSEIEGRTTVIYLVEEGTRVEPGDLLVELDSAELIDERIERQITVQNAEAAFIGARENLAIVESQGNSDVAQAELDFRFAEEDLSQYLEGEYPREVMEAESKITLALEELENAASTLQWSEKLFDEKYLSQTDLDKDRLAKSRAELDHTLAVSALGLLQEFTHKRKLAELESNINQTRMARDRMTRRAKAEVVQAEANLRAKQAEYERQKDQLAHLNEQLEKAKIYAPKAGMVVHATTGKGNWRGNDEPLQEGKEVREREELIYLPTELSMMAEISVHESSLDKILVGQRVNVSVDALDDKQFSGSVVRIAPLPDAQSVWMNPDLKVYPAEIHLDGEVSDIRTGMSCRAEVIVDRYEDVVYVPVQAVTRVGSQPTVYVRNEAGAFEERKVDIGLDNNHMVHVVSGLAAGEVVMLAPPLAPAASPGMAPSAGEGSEKPDMRSRPSRGPGGDGKGKGKSTSKAGAGEERAVGANNGRPSKADIEAMKKKMESLPAAEQKKWRERFASGKGGSDSDEYGGE